jgi:Dimerisation domain
VDVRNIGIDGDYDDTGPDTPPTVFGLEPKPIILGDSMTKSVPAGAQDYSRMTTMVSGFWVTQIVRAATAFNLADHLAVGIDTPDAIAAAESTNLDATRRLIRACASLGLVTSADGVHFTGTPLLSTSQGRPELDAGHGACAGRTWALVELGTLPGCCAQW